MQKRIAWESLRTEYAANFPMMKCTLPQNAMKMSKYNLSRESTMSDGELRELNEKKNSLFHLLRDARSNYRFACTKMKAKDHAEAVKLLEEAEELCSKVRRATPMVFVVFAHCSVVVVAVAVAGRRGRPHEP